MTTLNINNLTQDITPGSGVDGVNFRVRSGNITIDATANIETRGSNAEGIFARVNNSGDIAITSDGDITTRGSDAEGIFARIGDDGDITIISDGDITTRGTDAEGIFARVGDDGDIAITSVGNVATRRNNAEGIEAVVNDDGDIVISSTGDIATRGRDAEGIIGYVNDQGDVKITSSGNITTEGRFSTGIAGISGEDGDITINSTGNITTTGREAEGIVAYVSDDGDIDIKSTGNIATEGRLATGIYAVVDDDGDISISSTGNITTEGRVADGIFAYVDDNGDISITSWGNISTEGRYSFGIAGIVADDGDVTIASSADISTQGNDSIGIAAFVADSGAISITSSGNVTTTGNDAVAIAATTYGSGPITINSTGNISTSGSDADGINVDSSGGSVTINQKGDVTVTGNGSDAIDVDNANGAGNSTITIAAGSTITGGPGSGDGIDFQDGNINRVFNFGTITTTGENAIEGEGTGSELIFNSGTVTGNVDLGSGANAFNNQSGGIFNSGAIADLGAGNFLNNAGILSPGGNGTIQSTALTGNVIQSGSGQFNVDINVGSTTNDRLNVTGTAALNGNVRVQATNLAFGQKQFTILSAAGGTTNNGLGLIASPALQAALAYPNATDVVLGISLDFSPVAAGLNPNQTRIANNLNAILGAGGGTLTPIFNALVNGVFDVPTYRGALDQLSPEVYLMTETVTLFAAEEFTNNLFSCRTAGGGYAFIAEGQCVWVRPEGRFLNRDRTANNIGFDEDSGAFSAGAQVALSPGWFVGGALGYETASLNTSTNADSDSDRFNIGGVLKYQRGSVLFAAAVTGGIADFETNRHIDFGGFTAAAHSDHDVTYVAGQLRAAYLLSASNWYAKPLVDLNLTYLDRDALNETGGGAANLNVAGGDETFFSVTPAVEFGGDLPISGSSVLRPFIKAGVTFFSDDEHSLTARFAGAPGGVGAFAIDTEFDDVFADIETGLAVIDNQLGSMSISYEARIAEDTDQHGVVLKGTSRF